jgi:hypothetical protein
MMRAFITPSLSGNRSSIAVMIAMASSMERTGARLTISMSDILAPIDSLGLVFTITGRSRSDGPVRDMTGDECLA